jgi:hypothetical protein
MMRGIKASSPSTLQWWKQTLTCLISDYVVVPKGELASVLHGTQPGCTSVIRYSFGRVVPAHHTSNEDIAKHMQCAVQPAARAKKMQETQEVITWPCRGTLQLPVEICGGLQLTKASRRQ